jgi:pyridoxamine 5'-phosphate oxidase
VSDLRAQLRDLGSLEGVPPTPFDPGEGPADPTVLFASWFGAAVAANVPEPHAMTLSTVDLDGAPDARVLILKNLTPGCWWFASSRDSAKGRQLAESPAAALTFRWPAR